MGQLKNRAAKTSRSKSPTEPKPLSRPNFAKKFPELLDFLEIPRRSVQGFTTGSMTIFFEDGYFKICLNDRPNQRSVFVTSQELSKGFELAELGLISNSLNWRTKGYQAQPRQN